MKLYYSPGACSLAVHIALEESGTPFELERVDLGTHRTLDGRDFYTINPKGYVPVLELNDGVRLTESVTLLSYVAEHAPHLAPPGIGRWRALELLCFINSEINAGFNGLRSEAEKDRTRAIHSLTARYQHIALQMGGRPYAVSADMSIADCYLYVTLRWLRDVQIDPPDVLSRYADCVASRPAVLRALATEGLSR